MMLKCPLSDKYDFELLANTCQLKQLLLLILMQLIYK